MTTTESVHFIDPEQLAKITDLQVLARTVVEGVMAGLHRSPHSGSSIEFAQYRPYAHGDDLGRVVWTDHRSRVLLIYDGWAIDTVPSP